MAPQFTTPRDESNSGALNEKVYDDLLVTIEASDRILSLLVAVCDDMRMRDYVISRCEAELQSTIPCYRLVLARGEPSLRAAVAELVQSDSYLQAGGRAALMVIGAEQLHFMNLGAERSEQDVFFGYLQWTREGMREFPYPIVLWVTHQILVNLSQKAPDFWSWRRGVFRFISAKSTCQPIGGLRPPLEPIREERYRSLLSLDALSELIGQKQKRGERDAGLATFYASTGSVYAHNFRTGQSNDPKADLASAVEYLRKAVALQQELGLEMELVSSLSELANLYESQGHYEEAEPLQVQVLDLKKRLLGEDYPDIATSLNSLAELYHVQGRYEEAELLYIQALEMRVRLLGEDHPDVATSLHNLAGLYESQGRYESAEPLYIHALQLRKRLLGEYHPDVATSLNNLADFYSAQNRHAEARPFYAQAAELGKRFLGETYPELLDLANSPQKKVDE